VDRLFRLLSLGGGQYWVGIGVGDAEQKFALYLSYNYLTVIRILLPVLAEIGDLDATPIEKRTYRSGT
jgi:hypothetical protein